MYEQRNTFFVGYAPRGIGIHEEPCDKCKMELRISELLVAKGASQTQMAADLGVKQPTVSRWVSGESSPPTKNLAAIAAYFEVHPLQLFKEFASNPEAEKILTSLSKLGPSEILAVSQLVETLAQGRR